jgi:uroporphyrinogen decarboxylase
MTRKERIEAVVKGEIINEIPYHFDLTLKMSHRIAEYYNFRNEEVEEYIGNHFLYLSPNPPDDFRVSQNKEDTLKRDSGTYSQGLKKVDGNKFIDEFGVTWDNESSYDAGDWGMIDNPVKNRDLDNYKFPDGYAPGRFRGLEKNVDKHPDRFNVLLMTGLLDTAWHIVGIQDLLMSMATNDNKFIDKILDLSMEYIIGVVSQIPEYVEGVRFLEDWGGQNGLMMSLDHWQKFLKPRLRKIYNAVKSNNCTVISHSDGNITELFPELIELGVDVSDPTQPEVMDLKHIKKEFGKDIVFFGGLGCQSTIPLGTPDEVIKEVKDTIKILNEGGRYILGPSGSIPTEAPIDNVAVLIEFCKELVK